MSDLVLDVADLVAGYDRRVPIVNGVSLRVSAGEVVAILGPNGAGKSTLIKAIAGLVPIVSGSVELRGRDVTGFPAHEMVRHGLGFVPQTENVFAGMSIADNLKLSAGILEPARRTARIEAVYALFPDLAARPKLLAGRLSGGQRQMLAVARALVVHPEVLILDEPSAGLSPRLIASVFHMLSGLREGGVTIVLVEQNARAALAIADRGIILAEGKARHEGSAIALSGDPTIAALYLGVQAGEEGAPP
jgi:branched-chain amino acid transport system ATP-binding protein